MKIPTRIRINGHRWRVVREDTADKDLGECDFAARVIRLAPWLSKRDLEETFIHELLHACGGIEVDLYAKGQDELFVTLMAPRLLGALKDMGWVR